MNQTSLFRWCKPIDTNEPGPRGLHYNGYVWEYCFLPDGVYPISPLECIVRKWFHPSEGW
jgi:hypothetical protein